jgi:hypothetical protein
MKEKPVGGENNIKELIFSTPPSYFGTEFVSIEEFTNGVVSLERKEKAHAKC